MPCSLGFSSQTASAKGRRKIRCFVHTLPLPTCTISDKSAQTGAHPSAGRTGCFLCPLPFCCKLLLDSDGGVRAPDLVCVDPVTGLLTPSPHCTLLLSSQCPGPVPNDHFLHPETGKVLQVAGSVGYDPIGSRLVCVVDSASGKCHNAIIN